jgi:DNA replication protein DnaC
MNIFDLPERFRHTPKVKSPHTAGERSTKHALAIMARPPESRTPLQERMLQQHEHGECIGCTRQGIPVESDGNDVPLRYEPNGFAAPPGYCDCPKGERYQRETEHRRATYERSRVQEHLRFVHSLFGSACMLPPVMSNWTLSDWPVEQALTEEWTKEERERVGAVRRVIRSAVEIYAETLEIWDETSFKQGIALFGSPGVGKSGLLRCLEPLMLARGLSMISLYVPDLVVALESDQVEQMIAAIRATDVVLFDNLGFIVSLGYKESLGRLSLIRLINARWERQQKTFFTSNATEEQLSEQLGEDSVSRLHALCRFFEVPGLDLRREGGN